MIDFNLNEGKPIVNYDIDFIKQEIDILFDTTPGELHGDLTYGTDYEKCLYELQFSAEEMENKMYNDLSKMDLRGYVPTVSAYLLEGSEREIMVIEVKLARGYESYTTTYKIQ